MNDEEQNEFSDLREEIVAYLDGELEPDQTAVVERRLIEDEGYRHEMLQLQRTWELMGHLRQTELSDNFTASTMELAIEGELGRGTENTFWLRVPWNWMAILFCGFFALGSGYFVSTERHAARESKLLADSELLQNFSLIQTIDSFDELTKVHDSQLLVGLPSPRVILANDKSNDLNDGTLDPKIRQRLLQKQNDFQGLPKNEQTRIRDLHQSLVDSNQHMSLLKTQSQLQSWLAAISSKDRQVILSAPDSTRIESIKKVLVSRLEKGIEANLILNDRNVIRAWSDKLILQNKDIIEKAKPSVAFASEDLQVLRSAVLKELDMGVVAKIFTKAEIAKLESQLSTKGKTILAVADRNGYEQIQLRNWITQAAQESLVDLDKLKDFYQTELSLDQQQKVDMMSPRDRIKVLSHGYSRFADSGSIENWDPGKILPIDNRIERIKKNLQSIR